MEAGIRPELPDHESHTAGVEALVVIAALGTLQVESYMVPTDRGEATAVTGEPAATPAKTIEQANHTPWGRSLDISIRNAIAMAKKRKRTSSS